LSLKLNVLDELINNEILLERAKKLNLEASDGEVEDKFTEMKSPFTEEEFQKQLKNGGISVDDLKKSLRSQLSIQKLINREVVAKIAITDQDVTDFYNANKAQFNVAEAQYRIAQIVVTPRKEPQTRNRKNDDATNEAERLKAAYSANPGSGLLQMLDGMHRDVEGDHLHALARYLGIDWPWLGSRSEQLAHSGAARLCDSGALRVDRWREHGLSLLGQAGEGDVDDS